jgi:pyrimidine-nucleoside phosphorylase
MALHPAALIAKKRDGAEHLASEIHSIIDSFLDGKMTDYQMTAWLMAVYLNGLTDDEMLALTEAMLHSGTVRKVPSAGPARIDKHSTGGVGDKISLPLVGIVAACGVTVPMISGRGLGHTGGTLDKLESIPGYDTRLSMKKFDRVCQSVGASIIGQTADIAPADRRIYALRDVTGTVACRPLIVASILSKKLAAGLHGLVLDVKVGGGAFMKEPSQAKELAHSLVDVSTRLGTPAIARLSRMEEPLGRAIGNALEVVEAIEILRGEGPSDTTEITLTLADEMLVLAGAALTTKEARRSTLRALSSGEALARFRRMVELHGGDPRVVDDPRKLPKAPQRMTIRASKPGMLRQVDALSLARLALDLGAGRRRAEDSIDPAVGIEVHARVGDRLVAGDPLATLHVRKKSPRFAKAALLAFHLGGRKVDRPELFVGKRITAKKVGAQSQRMR